jgi:hypothetical protein
MREKMALIEEVFEAAQVLWPKLTSVHNNGGKENDLSMTVDGACIELCIGTEIDWHGLSVHPAPEYRDATSDDVGSKIEVKLPDGSWDGPYLFQSYLPEQFANRFLVVDGARLSVFQEARTRK